MEAKSISVNVSIVFNEESKLHILFCDLPSGPVVTSRDLEEGKKRFSDLFRLSLMLRNFENYKQFRSIESKSSNLDLISEVKKLKSPAFNFIANDSLTKVS